MLYARTKLRKRSVNYINFDKVYLNFHEHNDTSLPFSKKMGEYRKLMTLALDIYYKRPMKKRKKTNVALKKQINNIQADVTDEDNVESDYSNCFDDQTDLNYEPASNSSVASNPKKKSDLSEIIEAQCRYGSSLRATSAIVNATLRTFGISEVHRPIEIVTRPKKKVFGA